MTFCDAFVEPQKRAARIPREQRMMEVIVLGIADLSALLAWTKKVLSAF